MDPILRIWQRRLFRSEEAKLSMQRNMTVVLSENISGRIKMEHDV